MKELAFALAIVSVATHFLGIWWLSVPMAWAAYQAFSADEREDDYAVECIEVEDAAS